MSTTTYVQGTVREEFDTPDELVWAIRGRPREVRFDAESTTFGNPWSGRISDLPAGVTVTIFGRHHMWSVTVRRGRGGFKVDQKWSA